MADDTNINVDPNESVIPDAEADPSINDQKPSNRKKTPFKLSFFGSYSLVIIQKVPITRLRV